MYKATGFAHKFYVSGAWKRCREQYISAGHYLCERCLARGIYRRGDAVHHKVHLTPENINDPNITLAWSNLEMLCRECHEAEHENRRKWRTDPDGNVPL